MKDQEKKVSQSKEKENQGQVKEITKKLGFGRRFILRSVRYCLAHSLCSKVAAPI
ncbi:hypothetical protein JCM19037_3503 [Geomicrobium sp. JCM 19037]|uniref:hypothetical protein n=1 Tax=Geomicrobium sp. JCM 19037 TaxID=1460634 RepID=UPI00045F192F|nr:hypothetical protein [Geomicrobium sp. JCM 19037]GAK05037.1 hypothetical protein JCM19037_3503 [Geomicrobium sp. JCM 19037]